MKLLVALYRTVDFPSAWLTANINAVSGVSLQSSLAQRFGPFAPRMKFFESSAKTTAGIEVMSFDVEAGETPQAGVVMADPIDPVEINRVDGALRSELERMGIPMDADNFQWRIYYQTKGN